MNENKKRKKMSLESNNTAAEKMPSNEANAVSEKGKKSFGRKM